MVESRKLAAILAADIVGYSRLTRADEDRTLARLRALRSDLIDPTIAVHHGRIVKRTGDGAIVEFRSVVDAVRCAIEVQNAMTERNSGVAEESRSVFRIGIHVGDVVEEDDGDLMGDGVNVAARLEGVAKPGAICLSEDAYRQVKSRLDIAVADLGEQKLKKIAEPVRAYSVEVGGPASAPRAKPRAARSLALALAAVLVVGVLAAGVAAWRVMAKRDALNADATASPRVPTLLVSPLVNATGDAKFDATARRISDKTIGYLSGSIFWKAVNGADAAKDADYILGGNLEAGGPALRVSVYLSDAHSGARLWATTLTPILEDANASQAEEEVAGRAAAAIRYPLWGAELRRLEKIGQSDSAYGCLLKNMMFTPAEAARLRKCEEAAAIKEPDSAFAWEGLAIVLEYQLWFGWGLPPEEASAEKRAALAGKIKDSHFRAKELAPEDGEVQFGLAVDNFVRCDADRLRVEVAKTIALNPYDATRLGFLGGELAYIGDWDQGVAMSEKGIKLAGAAAHPLWWWASAARHFDRGEYQAAYDDFQRSYIESFWASHLQLTYSLVYLGRLDEAKAQMATMLKLFPAAATLREVDGYFKNACFSKKYRERVVDGFRKIGLPE